MIEISKTRQGLLLKIAVVPRASRSEIVGEHGGALKVRLAAPPVDGAANKELVKLIAKKLKIPKRRVSIASGTSSKAKTVLIEGADQDTVSRLLA